MFCLFSHDDDVIEFYIQLQRLTNMTSSHVDVTVELHRVNYTRTDDVTRSAVIYRHQVSDVTYLRYLLVQLGGISYRDGVLCWAPVDSILCAQLSRSDGRLKDVQTVVNTTQVEDICQGNNNHNTDNNSRPQKDTYIIIYLYNNYIDAIYIVLSSRTQPLCEFI